MNITFIVLAGIAITLLLISIIKSKDKTKKSLYVAKGMGMDIGGDILGLLLLVALFFALIPEGGIEALLGGENVYLAGLYGAGLGTVLILPKFVAIPMTADLIQQGAHMVVAATFITTLTMVGFATAPIEIQHFGKKYTLIRNVLSFIAAIFIGLGMMLILGW